MDKPLCEGIQSRSHRWQVFKMPDSALFLKSPFRGDERDSSLLRIMITSGEPRILMKNSIGDLFHAQNKDSLYHWSLK
jgi:hypothetical protein